MFCFIYLFFFFLFLVRARSFSFSFFFNYPATTEIYTLSLHDALPIYRVDPITVSVIQHRMLAIVEEMGEAMLRTSYSQILNSSRDFSTAICDLDGRLIAQAEHVPIHVGALPFAARAMTEFFEGDI